ncbi:hypothetical protein [Hymenobacter elongatus]|uniref:Uncharacterized protein n=1 Tax=Hymenobacter elongatus TaxID=877208 RepID=A0A4Z0PRB1_9BACT|nr:hypothetical protein [Hymenobacter elongatus]TGE19869.1 hypothetical protein E5J99_01865 [Hymenobacter elongatus]
MLRSWLVLLLLANYLLVVGAGLVNRPELPRYSAAHPYVHSHNCQQKHYLMVDCFDRCNGDQQAIQKRSAPETAKNLLSVVKGIDVHCLTETVRISPIYYASQPTPPVAAAPAVSTGFQAEFYSPPCQG